MQNIHISLADDPARGVHVCDRMDIMKFTPDTVQGGVGTVHVTRAESFT